MLECNDCVQTVLLDNKAKQASTCTMSCTVCTRTMLMKDLGPKRSVSQIINQQQPSYEPLFHNRVSVLECIVIL